MSLAAAALATLLGLVPPALLQPGSHHGEEVQVANGEVMLGLFPSASGFSLRRVRVVVERTFDPLVDDDGAATGKRVSTGSEHEALLLVGTGAGLTPGPVQAIASEGSLLLPGEAQELELGGVTTSVVATGSLAGEARSGPVVTDYRLTLERGGAGQLIAELPALDGAAPGLVWAGDLDRDGALDFVFDLSGSFNASRLVLFLSGAAGPGELAAPVAERITTGC